MVETAAGGHWKGALTVALFFATVYTTNVVYLKLVEDMGLTAIKVLGNGLQPVHQFLVLLLMSVCFAAAMLLHPGKGV